MVGLDKHLVDTDSSQAYGLASGFQDSMHVHLRTGVGNHSKTASVFFYFSCFTSVKRHITTKVYTKINLQLDKSTNEVDK